MIGCELLLELMGIGAVVEVSVGVGKTIGASGGVVLELGSVYVEDVVLM